MATHTQLGGTLAPAGSTLYVHDVDTGSLDAPPHRGIYWNNETAASNASNHFSIVAYPGFQPQVVGQEGFSNFKTTGQVVSKINVFSSNYTATDENGQPVGSVISSSPGDTFGILTTKFGRTIANRIQDFPDGLSNKYNGAINSNGGRVDNNKLFGNEIYDHGDHGSNRLQHTTYLSNRTDYVANAWEWGFSFLHGNRARWGIHQFDKDMMTGDVIGNLLIHDNVVIEQGGGGISIGMAGTARWSCDFTINNNIIINAGLPSDWDGVDPSTADGFPANGAIAISDKGDGSTIGLLGAIRVEHNLAYKYDASVPTGRNGALSLDGPCQGPAFTWSKNIAYSDQDTAFISIEEVDNFSLVDLTGSNNVWFFEGDSPANSTTPTFDTSPISADPLIAFDGAIATISSGSSASGQSVTTGHDIYGVPRTTTGTLGPVEVML